MIAFRYSVYVSGQVFSSDKFWKPSSIDYIYDLLKPHVVKVIPKRTQILHWVNKGSSSIIFYDFAAFTEYKSFP